MPSTILPITLILAAACALINIGLGLRIGQTRAKAKVWIGDAGSEPLVRRMRAQANFIENAPIVLVLVALIELGVGTNPWLAILAGAFVVARLVHPVGMDGWAPGRMIGAIVTMLVALVLAVWAVAIPVAAHRAVQHAERTEAVSTG